MIALVLAVVVALIFVAVCYQQKQKKRLAEAKAYFGSLETHDEEEDPEAEFLDNEEKKKTSIVVNETEESPFAETENELAVGDLF